MIFLQHGFKDREDSPTDDQDSQDDDEIEIISSDELNVASITAPKEEEPTLSDEDEVDSDVDESSEEKSDAGEENSSEQNEDEKKD